jgi:SAM-dependent methyltransferase
LREITIIPGQRPANGRVPEFLTTPIRVVGFQPVSICTIAADTVTFVTSTPTSTISRFDPIHSAQQMAELIASVTHQPVPEVLERLKEEFLDPGSTVARDFESRGIQRYVMSDEMTRFYSETDAFLYELAVWNRNANKRFMCRQILESIEKHFAKPVDVLSVGDGLGFDSLEFARAGHRVTYFELPGKTEACARQVFASSNVDVRVLTETRDLQQCSCDVLVCLDTLEHVPDPREFVRQLAAYLRPRGLLFVHAPYYMIHPHYPTHLRSSRKFCGDLSLYTDAGLRPVDGDLFWKPLVLAKADKNGKFPETSAVKKMALLSGGMLLRLGRWGFYPRSLVHWIRKRGNRWFDKTGKPIA